MFERDDLLEGRLAQLGERHVRNVEAEGSIPLPSTNFIFTFSREAWLSFHSVTFLSLLNEAIEHEIKLNDALATKKR